MFGNNKRIEELEAEVEKLEQIINNAQVMNRALIESIHKSCGLYHVSSSGRTMILHFRHNDKTFQINAYVEMGTTVESVRILAGL